MYRVKAVKGDQYVPILCNPEVIDEYSVSVVDTLHKKNLLLLGEDRFLTTLMIRTFPTRKMIFVPQAICKTVVPDEWKVLLSQRRRWINSTIHNLMELIFVRGLCGLFCFSMQFVIALDLFGSAILPAALVFTFFLVVNLFLSPELDIVPLIMLLVILFLPSILVLFTTRKIIYIYWLFIYLFALPIWNFILPMYAYWNMDDFSWGQTRKVEGEKAGDDHGNADGKYENDIPKKRWADWGRFYKRRTIASAI